MVIRFRLITAQGDAYRRNGSDWPPPKIWRWIEWRWVWVARISHSHGMKWSHFGYVVLMIISRNPSRNACIRQCGIAAQRLGLLCQEEFRPQNASPQFLHTPKGDAKPPTFFDVFLPYIRKTELCACNWCVVVPFDRGKGQKAQQSRSTLVDSRRCYSRTGSDTKLKVWWLNNQVSVYAWCEFQRILFG
jgi:hypothetical protein